MKSVTAITREGSALAYGTRARPVTFHPTSPHFIPLRTFLLTCPPRLPPGPARTRAVTKMYIRFCSPPPPPPSVARTRRVARRDCARRDSGAESRRVSRPVMSPGAVMSVVAPVTSPGAVTSCASHVGRRPRHVGRRVPVTSGASRPVTSRSVGRQATPRAELDIHFWRRAAPRGERAGGWPAAEGVTMVKSVAKFATGSLGVNEITLAFDRHPIGAGPAGPRSPLAVCRYGR